MRNALAHAAKGPHIVVATALCQALLRADQQAARQTWRQVTDRLRSRWPKLAGPMDDGEHHSLGYLAFRAQHRVKLHSGNPLERLDKEVERRADVVGTLPNEASITGLSASFCSSRTTTRHLQHRCM